MSKWNHSMCQRCWDEKNPDREAVKIREEYRDETPETCCFCGRLHGSGIYVRHDPDSLSCKGQHEKA
jgi:hypothetical protein